MRIAKIFAHNFHFGITLLLLLSIAPSLRAAGLPLIFDWAHFFKTFWLGLTIQSAFFACLLYVAAFPIRETVGPVWARYRRQKARLLILALLWAQLYYLFGATGLMFLSLVSITLPGVYWFASLVLVFSFNQAVVALKPHAAIDSWLLFGATVPDIAHRAYQAAPLAVLSLLDLLDFAMFAQVGAAMILLDYRYVVDLIGGMAVAAMAILLND